MYYFCFLLFLIILTNFSFDFDFCFGLSKLATVITKQESHATQTSPHPENPQHTKAAAARQDTAILITYSTYNKLIKNNQF